MLHSTGNNYLISVGNGYLKGYIESEKIDSIKNSTTPPTLSIWEKIKDFFCHTNQKKALDCLYNLYHHQEDGCCLDVVERNFNELKGLVSEGYKDKFKIVCNGDTREYCIDEVVLLSLAEERAESLEVMLPGEDDSPIKVDMSACTLQTNNDPEPDPSEMNITLTPEPEQAKSDQSEFARAFNIIMPQIQDYMLSQAPTKILKKLGLDAIKAKSAGEKIEKYINDDKYNKIEKEQLIKKELGKLLKIKKIIDLIPQDIKDMPEFITLQTEVEKLKS